MPKSQKPALSRTLYVVGFVLGLVLFVGANIYSNSRAVPPCCDFEIDFGVPFKLGRYGGYAGQTNLLLTGVIVDALIGLCASVVFGWVFAKSLSTLLSGIQHAGKWHVRTRL